MFEAPLRLGCITPFFLTISQNSKSKENRIWRAPVPAIGCLNPGIGVRSEPKTGLIWDTFALLNKLKKLRYHIEASRSAEWEVFQGAEVHHCQCGRVQRISAEAEWSGREGKGVTLI